MRLTVKDGKPLLAFSPDGVRISSAVSGTGAQTAAVRSGREERPARRALVWGSEARGGGEASLGRLAAGGGGGSEQVGGGCRGHVGGACRGVEHRGRTCALRGSGRRGGGWWGARGRTPRVLRAVSASHSWGRQAGRWPRCRSGEVHDPGLSAGRTGGPPAPPQPGQRGAHCARGQVSSQGHEVLVLMVTSGQRGTRETRQRAEVS